VRQERTVKTPYGKHIRTAGESETCDDGQFAKNHAWWFQSGIEIVALEKGKMA